MQAVWLHLSAAQQQGSIHLESKMLACFSWNLEQYLMSLVAENWLREY